MADNSGRPPRHKCHWTPDEENFLSENWGLLPYAKIASALGRSESAVFHRVLQLGLPRSIECMDGLPMKTLIKAVYGNANHADRTRKLWLDNGLPARTTTLGHRKMCVVRIDRFWKWAEKHQDLVNFAHMEPGVLGMEPRWVAKKRSRDAHQPRPRWAPWSPTEDAMLAALCKSGASWDVICNSLNHTQNGIEYRIMVLGLPHPPIVHKMWTEEETAKLVQMYNDGRNIQEIAHALGRHPQSVEGKICRMERTKGGADT